MNRTRWTATLALILIYLVLLSFSAHAQTPNPVTPGYQICNTNDPGVTKCSFQPVDLTHGLPTIGGELAADANGTFTNATQTSSVATVGIDGYGTALVSINGTYGTASGVFELTDDGGATWYSVQGSRINSCAVETGYTGLTNTNQAWTVPVSGGDQFRVRSTAVASGTVTVRISVSSAVPPTSMSTCSGALTYTHITGDATTVLKTTPALLHTVCINTPTATETITIGDSATIGTPTIAVITVIASQPPNCMVYDIQTSTGLTVVTATAASDLTVSWK